AALAGLASMVDRDAVMSSLTYLQGEVTRLGTPISLGWSLLGLAAWKIPVPNVTALVERCLANQNRYGEYEAPAHCLLFLGALAMETDGQSPLLSAAVHRGLSRSFNQ